MARKKRYYKKRTYLPYCMRGKRYSKKEQAKQTLYILPFILIVAGSWLFIMFHIGLFHFVEFNARQIFIVAVVILCYLSFFKTVLFETIDAIKILKYDKESK